MGILTTLFTPFTITGYWYYDCWIASTFAYLMDGTIDTVQGVRELVWNEAGKSGKVSNEENE